MNENLQERQNTPDQAAEATASTAMAEAWHRAEAAKAAAARRARADAIGDAMPWVLGAAAVAVLVMVARRLGRRRE